MTRFFALFDVWMSGALGCLGVAAAAGHMGVLSGLCFAGSFLLLCLGQKRL